MAKTVSMSKEEYAKFIILQLGGSVVDIELENDIESFLDLALLKVKPYICSTKHMTKPISECIDLSDDNVYTVIEVFRGNSIVSSTLTADAVRGRTDDSYLFSPGLFNYVNNLLGITSTDSVAITLLTNQVINQAYGRSGDIEFDYDFDEGMLYLETANAGCDTVTIEYIPDYKDVSEVKDPFWINYILNIAVASTKIALGRARGKYSLSNLPYNMDADTLLNEGNQEMENLMNKLEELNDIYFFED